MPTNNDIKDEQEYLNKRGFKHFWKDKLYPLLKSIKATLAGKQDALTAGDNINIQDGKISATDTTYGLSISGHTVTLTKGGTGTSVTVPDNNTNTTYSISKTGSTITLTGSDGSKSTVTDSSVTVDSALSSTSTNPVQNKVINSALSGKQDKGDYATKSEVTTEVNTQIAKVVANAPEDFDTLKEISDWIDKHEDSAAAMNSAIGKKQDKLTAGSNITIDANNKISATDTNTKYGLSISGHTVSLVENGATKSVTVPDNNTDTKYGLSLSGSTVSLVENGTAKSVTVPSNYHKINYITTGGTNSEGKEGYINFAQIKITGAYADAPISFEVTSRTGRMARIFVCFAGGNTSDPALNTSMTYVLSYNKTVYSEFYIVKASTSTWNLWYKKTEGWDHINVTDMYHAQDAAGETGKLTVTFPGAFAASAISGWVKLSTHFGLLTAGTNVTINNGVISSTNTDTTYKGGEGINLNGTTFSINLNIVYSANHANWISNTIDWNILIQPGSYKVHMASWGDASKYHSPNGTNKDIYSFGMLFVIGPDNEDLGSATGRENRLVQIYMPHDNITSVHMYKPWWYRYHNSNSTATGWSAWAPVGMLYTAGTGISMSDSGYNRVVTNSGVRSIGTGTTNGTISVNTNGTTANVAVKGLRSAAYTDSSSYLPLSGGTMTGNIQFKSVDTVGAGSAGIKFIGGTDTASIYYKLAAADEGHLIFNMGDNTNPKIEFAWNGVTKASIDSDGYYSGIANTAYKLRTFYMGVANTNNYPYRRFCRIVHTTAYSDADIMFMIHPHTFNNNRMGIFKVHTRCGGAVGKLESASIEWLVRGNSMPVNAIQLAYVNDTDKKQLTIDIFLVIGGAYAGHDISVLHERRDVSVSFYDTSEVSNTTTSDRKNSVNAYSSLADAATTIFKGAYTGSQAAIDGGHVYGANIATSWNGMTNDISTANTTDTWVPVYTNGKLQHRVMSANQGSASTPVYVTGGNFANTTSTKYGQYTHDSVGYGVTNDHNNVFRYGGNDYAGLDKPNDIDIYAWYGFSVTNSCTNAGTKDKVAFSVNARTGDTYGRTIHAADHFISDKYRNDGGYGNIFIAARDAALFGSTLTPTTANTYSPVLSVKTTTGNFTIGSFYNNGDALLITHDTDANYKAGKNVADRWTLSNTGRWSGSCARADEATNADMAECDSAGNVIYDTYAMVDTGTITKGPNVKESTLKIKKISNQVFLYGTISLSKYTASNLLVSAITIPVGFRPQSAITVIGGIPDYNVSPKFMQLYIGSGGTVDVFLDDLKINTTYTINAHWFV